MTTPRTLVPSAPAADQDCPQNASGQESEAPSFLQDLRLNHGPVQLIGRFLLRADSYLRDRGILLSFDRIATIAALNERQFSTWGRFAPQLDARIAPLTDSDSYCLVGRSADGAIVATQAGRIYDVGNRSLYDIAADRSLYYGSQPPPHDGITCTLTAPSARDITGCFVYSGGLWVRPEFRGHKLAALLPRISRAYAHGRWNTRFTFAFIGAKMANSPLLGMYGYNHVEPSYTFFEDGQPVYTGSLMWMDAAGLAADLEDFLLGGFEKIDGGVGHRSRDDKWPATG
jgi:hypothetical protein